MDQSTYRIAAHDERLILARRSGELLMLLSSRLQDKDRLAEAIRSSSLIIEVVEGKLELPIKGLQWLRQLEAESGGIDGYAPSLLLEVALEFETHIAGAMPSQAYENLANLELRVRKELGVER